MKMHEQTNIAGPDVLVGEEEATCSDPMATCMPFSLSLESDYIMGDFQPFPPYGTCMKP